MYKHLYDYLGVFTFFAALVLLWGTRLTMYIH